ncbi:hypothetical protein [Sphingomonas sp. G-3-2-10]|uniref:hypothetical protein n=1 Tax=Sphingomonas sp. G-3-2-10 TaxID=2728838 RepID=UPI00146D53B5|nr:hypothetical protein [Sphingomonas sp. G-3-2-10]NML07014.1 hypothetical protein [Sphingomonas sp. G-3-2-10]
MSGAVATASAFRAGLLLRGLEIIGTIVPVIICIVSPSWTLSILAALLLVSPVFNPLVGSSFEHVPRETLLHTLFHKMGWTKCGQCGRSVFEAGEADRYYGGGPYFLPQRSCMTCGSAL